MKQVNFNDDPRLGLDLCIETGTAVKIGKQWGIIDEVFEGQGYGFVTSDGNGWEGRMITGSQLTEIEILSEQNDINRAKKAAVEYFILEGESLARRMGMMYENDDPQRLQEMLDYCLLWIGKIGSTLTTGENAK